MLFDLENDPDELNDLGDDPEYADKITDMHRVLGDWALRFATRTTRSDRQVEQNRGASLRKGIFVGFESEDDLPDDVRQHLTESLNPGA